jgi:hypothetical protein
MEDRVRYLREANGQNALATDLDREAAELRAQGNMAEADARAQEAAAARAAAAAAQTSAAAQVVDESKLAPLQSSALDVDDGSADVVAAAPADLAPPADDADFADDVVGADSLSASVSAIDDATDDLTAPSVPDVGTPAGEPAVAVIDAGVPAEAPLFADGPDLTAAPALVEPPDIGVIDAAAADFTGESVAGPVVDDSFASEQDPIDPAAPV